MRHVRYIICALAGLVCGLPAGAVSAEAEGGIEFFERRVRPILVERCYECHSAGKKMKGGLALDTREGWLKGGDLGPVVAPGKPEESLLIKAVRYGDEDLQMPPKHRLDRAEIRVLEQWVAMGAPDPRTNAVGAPPPPVAGAEHWAFRPVRDVRAPRPANDRWAANDIDRFVLARLKERGLEPNPPADRRTLIRRATFDLIGLPPTPEEVEAFVQDRAPGAFERVIDRLLASPHYGERWGRHWLDVVRYADTAGDSSDYPVPQAYLYRNWVIEAFNRDKPYDRFLREQIAGDLLPAANAAARREQIIATGFVALSRRFSVEPDSAMHLTIEDTLDTIGRSVLGLSLSCARCHDHKFDPVTMRDYYGLYGIFSSTRYPYAGSEEKKRQRDFVALYSEAELDARHLAEKAEYQAIDEEVQRLEKQLELAKREGLNDPEIERNLNRARIRRDDILTRTLLEDTAYAVAEGKPANAKIHVRGEPSRTGDETPRGFLAVLGGQQLPKEEKGSGRAQLAEWLTDAKNPLTSRVMVNRIWQRHFGKGLVPTPSDFGARGQPPTHPELLDYLAGRFVASGWSIKAMHKLIMSSKAYQQSSADDATKLARDPANDWLWKFSRQRLEAEAIRDAMMAVAGTLERATGEMHPFPPPSRWDYTQHNQFTAVYQTRQRSVYLMQQRIRRHPFMATFDGADPNTSTAARMVSTTPLQALYVLNDRFVHEQARHFAERLIAERAHPTARVARAYELIYNRPPWPEEERAAVEFVRAAAGRAAEERAWTSFTRALFGSNEFIYVD